MPGKELFELYGLTPLLLGVLLLFWKADDALSGELKNDLSSWLKGTLKYSDHQYWLMSLQTAFKQVFGQNHVSWRCFFRSVLASMISFCMFAFYFNAVHSVSLDFLILSFWVALLPNTIGDYFSLAETRYLLSLMARRRLSIFWGILIDIIASLVVFSTFYVMGLVVVLSALDISLREFLDERAFSGGLSPELLLFLISLLTAYVTSIWIWFAAIGSIATRILPVFVYAFPVNERPMRSIGTAGAVLVVIGLFVDALIGHFWPTVMLTANSSELFAAGEAVL